MRPRRGNVNRSTNVIHVNAAARSHQIRPKWLRNNTVGTTDSAVDND